MVDNVVKFEPRKNLVYQCPCGGQQFLVEVNPNGQEYPCLHRCYMCSKVMDLYELFFAKDDEE